MGEYRSILLIDSDPIFRGMVKAMIQRHYPEINVNEACSREEAMQQVKRFRPGLILTEIDIRGRRALDLPQRMLEAHPGSIIAVLTSYDLPEYREASLQSGARHFISKSRPSGKTIREIVDTELVAPSRAGHL